MTEQTRQRIDDSDNSTRMVKRTKPNEPNEYDICPPYFSVRSVTSFTDFSRVSHAANPSLLSLSFLSPCIFFPHVLTPAVCLLPSYVAFDVKTPYPLIPFSLIPSSPPIPLLNTKIYSCVCLQYIYLCLSIPTYLSKYLCCFIAISLYVALVDTHTASKLFRRPKDHGSF